VKHRVSRDLHAIARNRQLTAAALGYTPDDAIDFALNGKASALGSSYGILSTPLHASTSNGRKASWVALAQSLAAGGHSLLLPWGNAAERLRSEHIAAATGKASVPPPQPLDSLAGLIAGASFVIGVDTGLLHLAAALGVPLVAIFVGSEPGLTGPVGRGPIASCRRKAHAWRCRNDDCPDRLSR
jgi:heptosyltransferase-1